MSLALGKNNVNAKQPLHLDATNHLLVNDSTNKAVLDQIATNTSNINVNVDSLEVNTDGLETLQTTTNTTLASILIDTDAIDSSCNTIEAQSVLTASRLNNIQNKISANTDGTGDTLGQIASNILTKATSIETAVQILDNAISGNEMQVDIVSSALPSGGATESTLSAAEVHLGHIQTAVELIDNAISGSEMQVDIVSSALPSGAATEATLAANEAHVGSIDGKITACNTGSISGTVAVSAVSGNVACTHASLPLPSGAATEATLSAAEVHLGHIQTAVELIDNAISGSEMQVDVVSSALPSGAATESTLSAAEVHLGHIQTAVEAIDDIVLTEDAAHSSGQKGVMFLGVRQSSQADFAADGDYTPLSIDDDGKLRVTSSAASGGATEAKQDVIETTLTAIETDAAAIEVLLTGMDSDTDAIKTSTAACATDLAALEVLQTSTNSKLDHLSGDLDTIEATLTAIETDQAAIEVLLTAANTDHAANEVLLTAIDADTSNIATSTAACATDLAALEVLQTATNSKLDDMIGHNDGVETLLTAIDGRVDGLETLQGAANTDLAAIEVLLTAANTDHAANEVLLTAVDQKLGDIETAVQLIDNAHGDMTTETLQTITVGASSASSTNTFTKQRDIKYVGVAVVASVNGSYNAFLEYSVDNSTFFQGANINFSANQESTAAIGDSAYSSGYRYWRVNIANNHSGSQDFVVKLSY